MRRTFKVRRIYHISNSILYFPAKSFKNSLISKYLSNGDLNLISVKVGLSV